MAEHKEEIVISGIGGLFPECNNVEEFCDLLFNKTNAITIDSRRWNPNELSGISGVGKLKNVDKFDTMFFSAHPKLAEVMDPMTRLCLERSIEAIVDAGLSPMDLSGTKTGVFTGSAISETEMFALDGSKSAAFSMLGRSRTMQANRVSYILNLIGPSFSMDGGWICGSNGLEKAKEMIENGYIQAAIVGVTNLVLRPEIQLQFQGLNRLTRNDHTKPFSFDADGYNRSEACVVMLLQKASEAKRSYGTLLNVKSMQFGDHNEHISSHENKHFKSLLVDCYKEVNVDPSSVDFVEAYGSGIKNDDKMELNVLEEVFCTKSRRTPLKVGSVKSNVGHSEPCALFVSIVKAIVAFESGYIPPNINYTGPNENVDALKTGNIQIVTEKTPLVGDIIGVTGFGLVNSFSHVILRRNPKVKTDTRENNNEDNTPRLILVSGRNEENTRNAVKIIMSRVNDPEYLALINNIFTKTINAHFVRTYAIFPESNENRVESVWNVTLQKRPVWFIFSGMGSQWQGMGTHLLKIPIFADSIDKIDAILKPRGVDIKKILTNQDSKIFDSILNSFVGIAAIQIGLVDVLKALDIKPDGYIGHSVGELGCAYADGCFTAEEMILSAYARGRASVETELIKGMMAAIGLGYEQIKNRLPHDVDVACHNSAKSCTISGPVDSVNAFVADLKSEGIFAKAVNVANIAYHSRYIKSAAPTLLKYLKEVIKEPKTRSSKWISSSIHESEWTSELAQCSSPEYHTNNLLSSVLFEDAIKHIPSDAVVIEIAPHGLLQAILKSALPDTLTNIPLTKRMCNDSVQFLLTAVGNMYVNGLNPKIQALSPSVTFPVGRGTPSINSLPLWDHSQQWTPVVTLSSKMHACSEKLTSLSINNNIHLSEYQLYGQHIVPFSLLLYNVWQTYVEMNTHSLLTDPIQFMNLRFKNNFKIYSNDTSYGYIMVQRGTGYFEYNFDDEIIMSGTIHPIDDACLVKKTKIVHVSEENFENFQSCSSNVELYTVLENSGYYLGDEFKNIFSFNTYNNHIQGYVKWKNDWVYFLEGLLKFSILDNLGTHSIETPIAIREITVFPRMFENYVDKNIYVDYNIMTNEINCNGIKISGILNGPIILPSFKPTVIKLEQQAFFPFDQPKCKNVVEFINYSMDFITEVDKFNLDGKGKIILCTSNNKDDLTIQSCNTIVKQFLENQLSINYITLNRENDSRASNNDDSGRYITVANFDNLQDTMKFFTNKKHSYIVLSSSRKCQDFKNWKILTQQQFNNNDYLTLMKKIIPLDENSTFIKSTYDNYDSSIWKAIEKNKSSIGMVYIISKTEPLEGISEYIAKCFKKYQSNNLRFLFILDSTAPEFETQKLFYVDQLSKGLIANIYKNGGWGSYKRTVVQHLNEHIKIAENVVKFNNFSDNSKTELAVKYLGVNFKDLVVEDKTENEFGPVEYSGYTRDGNEAVMGIIPFEQIPFGIDYDNIFMWRVPSTWSLEDATTVPLPYALSYYVFNILCSLQHTKSVLVNSGLHPIGQAAISICLAKGDETYAVVDSDHQANQLSNIFPELPRSRIIVNQNNNFDIKVMMMTKAKGVDVVLNFLSGNGFHSALRTLASGGKAFHFSKSDIKNQETLGTRVFLKNTSFSVVSSDILLKESDRNKQIVCNAFTNGLNKGVIKPFNRTVLTMPFNSSRLFKALRTTCESEKVVLYLSDSVDNTKTQKNIEHDTYQCHADHVYLVIGDKSDWLDLAEWLVDRGARKIIVSIKRCFMSSMTCRRFDRLILRNASIQIESDSYLKSKQKCADWLTHLTTYNTLGSLFIVNQFDSNKINNLRCAFEEYTKNSKAASFICLSSKGEQVCAELKASGVNALNISWDEMSTQSNKIAKLLISLDTLLLKSNTVTSSSFICSRQGINRFEWSRQITERIENYFPESIEELYLLNKKITNQVEFIEIQTKSPRYSNQKGILPVFIIPGFKPKLIETFYKYLSYPAFEARFTDNDCSIDELSEILVNKLKNITYHNSVTLIGESWGGIVALKMAQMLEQQGVVVFISLLEGDPEILTGFAQGYLSNDYINNTLHFTYSSYSNVLSQCPLQTCGGRTQITDESNYNKELEDNVSRVLKIIRSRLRAVLETNPLSNKLLAKVFVFRYDRTFELNRTLLNEYCVNKPYVHIFAKNDYKQMILDKEIIQIINKETAICSSVGVELSLEDKYSNYHYYTEKFLQYLT